MQLRREVTNRLVPVEGAQRLLSYPGRRLADSYRGAKQLRPEADLPQSEVETESTWRSTSNPTPSHNFVLNKT
jgi:hypothetical protein